jgi:predicted signal transduction protein with EAL and GGDEF domain
LTIGIALYPEHGNTPEALMHRADGAMYHAKRQARGTFRLADSSDEQFTEEQENIRAVKQV